MNEESLFAEAMAKKGEARAAILDSHCKDDVELRKRLEALLRANDNPDPFLDAPAPLVGATVDETAIREGVMRAVLGHIACCVVGKPGEATGPRDCAQSDVAAWVHDDVAAARSGGRTRSSICPAMGRLPSQPVSE